VTLLRARILQPERYVSLGIDPPKGVLLYGPPGTGKTLCARAVANRTDACFIRVIGSELVQKYVGEVCCLNQFAGLAGNVHRVLAWCGSCSKWHARKKPA
jgi:ATP-dependent 26S proteasome regulatory subunit